MQNQSRVCQLIKYIMRARRENIVKEVKSKKKSNQTFVLFGSFKGHFVNFQTKLHDSRAQQFNFVFLRTCQMEKSSLYTVVNIDPWNIPHYNKIKDVNCGMETSIVRLRSFKHKMITSFLILSAPSNFC